ncbi:UNVERIFIED_CONTAM: hypothetical protein BEN50_10135 [Euhalothece sp. KZN 001]
MIQTPTTSETETLLMAIPNTIALQVTEEQFTTLAAANRDLRLERTSQGELIVNPPTGWETGEENWKIAGELYIWWRNFGEVGKVFDSSTGFTLPNGAIRSPDASWVSRERWEALTPEDKTTFPKICPDFVVELRSKSDKLPPLQEKMREYLENGAKLGWLIDPQSSRVEIYQTGKETEILENPTQLSGEPVLPGFILNLTRILN